MTRTEAIDTFLKRSTMGDYTLTPVSGDASFRSYHRVVTPLGTYMFMDAPPEKEDVRPYIHVAEALLKAGYSAPAVIAKDESKGLLLLEDLGDTLFSTVLKAEPARERALYQAAVDVLVEWHHTAITPLPPYGPDVLMREVALFAEWYIPAVANVVGGVKLADTFLALWQQLLAQYPQPTTQFVHRDYHVSNLMWLPGRKGVKTVGQLDFQDALHGAPAYDLVSLLEDARRSVPRALQAEMLEYYLQKTGLPRPAFLASYTLLGAQRNFKILGIFVRLWKRDGKAGYLDLIPRVWAYLIQDLQHPHLAPLKTWVNEHMPSEFRTLSKDHA